MNRVNFQQGLAMTTVNQNQEKTQCLNSIDY
jgi:hypothetical protein